MAWLVYSSVPHSHDRNFSLFAYLQLSFSFFLHLYLPLFCWRTQTQSELKRNWQVLSSSFAPPLSSSHRSPLAYMPPTFHSSLLLSLQLSGAVIIKDSCRSLGSFSKSFCQTDRVSQISLPLTGGDIQNHINYHAHRLAFKHAHIHTPCGLVHNYTICPAPF